MENDPLQRQDDLLENERNRIRLLQYENLREHFDKMAKDVLGDDYYNLGMDVYECDRLMCEDITRKANESIWDRIRHRLFGY